MHVGNVTDMHREMDMLERSGMETQGRRNVSDMDAGTLAALGLKKETVFVPMEEPKPRTANAERVARHRQKKAKAIAEAGLDAALVPKGVSERIKTLGFETWLETMKSDAVTEFSKVPRPPTLGEMLGAKILEKRGWRRRLIDFLLG